MNAKHQKLISVSLFVAIFVCLFAFLPAILGSTNIMAKVASGEQTPRPTRSPKPVVSGEHTPSPSVSPKPTQTPVVSGERSLN